MIVPPVPTEIVQDMTDWPPEAIKEAYSLEVLGRFRESGSHVVCCLMQNLECLSFDCM